MRKQKKINVRHKVNMEKITGVLDKHKAGFGFVRQEEGGDIFVARSNMNGAMHGDFVEVDLLPEYLWARRSREGIIDKVLERANTEVVGTFQKNKRFGFVISDDRKNTDDVFVRKSDFRNAQNGDKVVVKITKYPEKNVSAEGKITEIISRLERAAAKSRHLSELMDYLKLFQAVPMPRQKQSRKKSLRRKNCVGGVI